MFENNRYGDHYQILLKTDIDKQITKFDFELFN